jgi:hypothetical protein
MTDLVTLHRQLRAVDERAEAIRDCPGLTPATRVACLETCKAQALQALEDAGEGVIEESFDWFGVYGSGGQVEELRDARVAYGFYGLPAPEEDR